MIHPHTELKFISSEIGYGVVATQFIPKGTITWVQDKLDRIFTPLEVEEMDPLFKDILNTYTFRNREGNHVLCWDNSRFVNHSFRSNCLTTAYNYEIAIRDIHPGEELTDDYGYLNITEPFKAVSENTKRKVVYPDDLLRYHKIWDKKLLEAMRELPQVAQPLKVLIRDEVWDHSVKVARHEEEMASILECYYDPSGTFHSNGHSGKNGKAARS